MERKRDGPTPFRNPGNLMELEMPHTYHVRTFRPPPLHPPRRPRLVETSAAADFGIITAPVIFIIWWDWRFVALPLVWL